MACPPLLATRGMPLLIVFSLATRGRYMHLHESFWPTPQAPNRWSPNSPFGAPADEEPKAAPPPPTKPRGAPPMLRRSGGRQSSDRSLPVLQLKTFGSSSDLIIDLSSSWMREYVSLCALMALVNVLVLPLLPFLPSRLEHELEEIYRQKVSRAELPFGIIWLLPSGRFISWFLSALTLAFVVTTVTPIAHTMPHTEHAAFTPPAARMLKHDHGHDDHNHHGHEHDVQHTYASALPLLSAYGWPDLLILLYTVGWAHGEVSETPHHAHTLRRVTTHARTLPWPPATSSHLLPPSHACGRRARCVTTSAATARAGACTSTCTIRSTSSTW